MILASRLMAEVVAVRTAAAVGRRETRLVFIELLPARGAVGESRLTPTVDDELVAFGIGWISLEGSGDGVLGSDGQAADGTHLVGAIGHVVKYKTLRREVAIVDNWLVGFPAVFGEAEGPLSRFGAEGDRRRSSHDDSRNILTARSPDR